ncbi:hypothetical protein R1flu_028697 [Riccia fluitans]|uniref:Elongation factor P n=1 Tax=Riccia fluitans TaxID=41844 RepID=A0ABD1XMY4_9MARC
MLLVIRSLFPIPIVIGDLRFSEDVNRANTKRACRVLENWYSSGWTGSGAGTKLLQLNLSRKTMARILARTLLAQSPVTSVTLSESGCYASKSLSPSAQLAYPPWRGAVTLGNRRLSKGAKVSNSRTRVSGVCWALSSNEFRNGTNIEIDGAPWKILEFLHVKPGKGAAFVRTKLRNYVTGNTVERTFRAGENVDEATVTKEFKQFTYKDGEQYVFMDSETYEEVRVSEKEIGDRSKFLMEGMECSVLTWNGRVIDIDLPVTVKLKVIQADPGVKGDTAQGGSKIVTVETGAAVSVPLFVNQDDIIVIQTKDGSYISRG